MQRFGEKLRILRERHGVSQQQLAKQCGFTRFFVSALENERKKPNVELVIKLANIFGVSVDALVRDELDV